MSRALSMIRNPHAIARLVRIQSKHWDATRTLPLDNMARSRAQSLLAGTAYRDGSANPGTLTLAQAQDVLRWAASRIL
jgi:hypothetical protein